MCGKRLKKEEKSRCLGEKMTGVNSKHLVRDKFRCRVKLGVL